VPVPVLAMARGIGGTGTDFLHALDDCATGIVGNWSQSPSAAGETGFALFAERGQRFGVILALEGDDLECGRRVKRDV
jgi:hypothetical protein